MFEIVLNSTLRLCRNFIDLGLLGVFLFITSTLFVFFVLIFATTFAVTFKKYFSVLTYPHKLKTSRFN